MLRKSCILLAACVLVGAGNPVKGQVVESSPIYLTVRVPATATLEIDGVRTQVQGEVRQFVSPALPVGQTYIYALKATWSDGAKKFVSKRDLRVQPGKSESVDLREGAVEEGAPATPPVTTPATKPVAKAEPKAEPKPVAKAEPKAEAKPVETVKAAAPKSEGKILVPYVPTPQEIVDKMLELGEVKQGDVVYDLGCGDGRIVVTAAKKFGAKGLGVDLDPERVKDSLDSVKKAGVEKLVEIKKADVLTTDVSPASVVTLYLLPEVNLKLMPILKSSLKKGSRIVSHDFDMGDWKPVKKLDLVDKDGIEHTLYLWKIE